MALFQVTDIMWGENQELSNFYNWVSQSCVKRVPWSHISLSPESHTAWQTDVTSFFSALVQKLYSSILLVSEYGFGKNLWAAVTCTEKKSKDFFYYYYWLALPRRPALQYLYADAQLQGEGKFCAETIVTEIIHCYCIGPREEQLLFMLA